MLSDWLVFCVDSEVICEWLMCWVGEENVLFYDIVLCFGVVGLGDVVLY